MVAAEPPALLLHQQLDLAVMEWLRVQLAAAGFGSLAERSDLDVLKDLSRYALILIDESMVGAEGLPAITRRLRQPGSPSPALCLLVTTLEPEQLRAGWDAGIDLHLIKSDSIGLDRLEISILALGYPELVRLAFRRILRSFREARG